MARSCTKRDLQVALPVVVVFVVRLEREIRRERDEGEDGHNQASDASEKASGKGKHSIKLKISELQFLIT